MDVGQVVIFWEIITVRAICERKSKTSRISNGINLRQLIRLLYFGQNYLYSYVLDFSDCTTDVISLNLINIVYLLFFLSHPVYKTKSSSPFILFIIYCYKCIHNLSAKILTKCIFNI